MKIFKSVLVVMLLCSTIPAFTLQATAPQTGAPNQTVVPNTAAQTPGTTDVPAVAAQCADKECSPTVFWWVFWVVTLFLAGAFVFSARSLRKRTEWSLGDALSEESGTTDPGGRPNLVASSSRLIAFLGLIGILGMFLGASYYVIWHMFTFKEVPNMENVQKFFYGGAVIFAPYLVNKLSEAVKAFK